MSSDIISSRYATMYLGKIPKVGRRIDKTRYWRRNSSGLGSGLS